MSQLLRWMDENSELVFPLFFLWFSAYLAFSAWRRHRSQPLHPPYASTDVRFVERYVSGSSDKNLVTKLGGANNALVVTVLEDALLIEIIAGLKWLVPPGFGDLEHYITKQDILRIEPASKLGRKTVRLEIRGRDGMVRTLNLVLRKRDEFLAALRS